MKRFTFSVPKLDAKGDWFAPRLWRGGNYQVKNVVFLKVPGRADVVWKVPGRLRLVRWIFGTGAAPMRKARVLKLIRLRVCVQ